MTLQQLRYIIEVARCRSITEAAEKLFVTQPSITTAIRNLESEFGIEIFNRSAKGVEITNDGEAFLCYAKQVLEQEEMMKEHFFGKHSQSKTIFSVSSQHYGFVVKSFCETLKSLDVEKFTMDLVETQTHDVINNVASRRSELGVLYLNQMNESVLSRIIESNDVEILEVAMLRLYIILGEDHPYAQKKAIGLDELTEYPYIVFLQGGNSNFFAEKTINRMRFPKNILVNDRATLEDLICNSNCFTVGPKILPSGAGDKKILSCPMKNEQELRIVVLKKVGVPLSDIAKLYLESLRNVLKDYTEQ